MSHDSEDLYDIDANAPHGFDDTPPRDKTILIWTVGSALLLVALVPLFHSYWNAMSGAERAAKVEAQDQDGDGRVDYLAEREAAFADARRALSEAPVNLDAAMQQLVSQGRNVPAVRPRATDGANVSLDDALASLAAVEGWTLRKHEGEREAAANAIVQNRAREAARRLDAAHGQAVLAKLDDDAAAATAQASRLRSAPSAEDVTAAETWLVGFAQRLAAVQAAPAVP
jgi:hypothetical protein